MRFKCDTCKTENDVAVLKTETIIVHSIGYPLCPLKVYNVVCPNCQTADRITTYKDVHEVYEYFNSQGSPTQPN